MSIEINRLIRLLEKVAENNSSNDLFVKVHDEFGNTVDPDVDYFEFDNDHSDRVVVMNGKS